MKDKDIRILVAAHKPYWMPSDDMYVPVQVGATGKDSIEGFQRDDEDDNISIDNPHYCELTGLYWGWKNLSAQYLGLAHYRRHFKGSGERGTLTKSEAIDLLSIAPVVLPKIRKYYIETIESHYGNTFDIKHISFLRDAIETASPKYSQVFEKRMRMKQSHMWNMFIMHKDLVEAYCEWLFAILTEVEKRIDFSKMSPFEARVMGRLSEILLDTWLDTNNVKYVECPVVGLEKTNWIKKGSSFLAAKFLNKKYKESF